MLPEITKRAGGAAACRPARTIAGAGFMAIGLPRDGQEFLPNARQQRMLGHLHFILREQGASIGIEQIGVGEI